MWLYFSISNIYYNISQCYFQAYASTEAALYILIVQILCYDEKNIQ